jgi:predicted nucleotidyltransferase
MDIREIQKPLRQFTQAVSEHIRIDDIIVFGSYARGEATVDSDIDVIVVSKEFEKMPEDDRLSLLYRVSAFIRPEIQPWGFTPDELAAKSRLNLVGAARDSGVHIGLS